MKVCVKLNEFNPSLLCQDWCSEELAIQMGYKIVDVDDKYSDCTFDDFDENLDFSISKYNSRVAREKEEKDVFDYENLVVSLIRKKYTINQELAILRQQNSKPQEYEEYFNYVEECKLQAKASVDSIEF